MASEEKRIKHLENMSLAYNIAGGISIGVIIILIGVVIYLFIQLRKISKHFTQKMMELDRLGRFTIKRPQVDYGDLNVMVQNRFRMNESKVPPLFDTSVVDHQYPSQNDPDGDNRREINQRQPNARVSALHNMMARSAPNQNSSAKSDNFLHRGSDR